MKAIPRVVRLQCQKRKKGKVINSDDHITVLPTYSVYRL